MTQHKCVACKGRGLIPVCILCGRRAKVPVRLTPEEVAAKIAQERRDEIIRHRDNEETKLLKRMRRNMSKTGSTTTGSITTDMAIFLLGDE